jgi:hypothetical protein
MKRSWQEVSPSESSKSRAWVSKTTGLNTSLAFLKAMEFIVPPNIFRRVQAQNFINWNDWHVRVLPGFGPAAEPLLFRQK